MCTWGKKRGGENLNSNREALQDEERGPPKRLSPPAPFLLSWPPSLLSFLISLHTRTHDAPARPNLSLINLVSSRSPLLLLSPVLLSRKCPLRGLRQQRKLIRGGGFLHIPRSSRGRKADIAHTQCSFLSHVPLRARRLQKKLPSAAAVDAAQVIFKEGPF